MDEVLPGAFHWRAVHPNLEMEVDVEHLLFAHGEPLLGAGPDALRALAEG